MRKIFTCRWCGYPEVPVAGSWQLGGMRYQSCPKCFRTHEVQGVRKEGTYPDMRMQQKYTARAYDCARRLQDLGAFDAAVYWQRAGAIHSLRDRQMRGVE